jgi:(R,R)-butanediol dehydrogenase/meso-butanediol dehydrogenase/diacetyl reductase
MKALVYEGKNDIAFKQIEQPVPATGEALIRVKAAGICGTDLSILAGKHPRAKAPLIMGHEFSGDIVSINSDKPEGLKVGERVTAEPLISCGECIACKSGFAYVCHNLKLYGIDRNGAFAQYVTVATDRLYKVPDSIGYQSAALIEPLAVAVHAVRSSGLKAGDSVCVLGAGPIGLLTALVLKNSGADRILVCEREPYRIKLAREYGFHIIEADRGNTVEEIMELTSGRGVDIVFEAAGGASTFVTATKICRVRGEVVMIAMPKDLVPCDIVSLTFKELVVKGVRVYAPYDFERAINIMSNSGIDFSKLLSSPFPLERGVEAFTKAGKGKEVMRVLIDTGAE